MIATEPKIVPTGRYSIKEACEKLEISRRSLDRYTKDGRLKFGIRRATGKKFYLGRELLKFWIAQL